MPSIGNQRGITDANGQFDFLVGVPPYLDTCLLAASSGPHEARDGSAC